MNIKIKESTLEKIRSVEFGSCIEEMLLDITGRNNDTYNRGIVHGYLLALTVADVITSDEALEILDQIER